MKYLIAIPMIFMVTSGLVQAEEMKRYTIKSAKIEYEIKGSADVMGMVKIKTVGKKRLIFDNYGTQELEEENKISKETTMGKTKVNKTHTMKYMNGSIIYSINFEKKEIMRQKNSGMMMVNMLGGGNLVQKGEDLLQKMGGKKIGTAKVAGYTCDIWNLSGIKQCLYKGIPLRIESDIMGMKNLEIATKAEFELSLTKDDFKLPDYPVFEFDMDKMMAGEKPKKLDKSKLEEMDKESNLKSEEKAKEGTKALKGMGEGIKAAKKAGYDPTSGKDMTPIQEKAMEKAMMEAMGGEAVIVEQIKNELFADKEEMKSIPSRTIECVKKAKTMNALKICLPENDKE